MCVVLLGLGCWQVQRAHWKNDVLAKMHARMELPARRITPDDFDTYEDLFYQTVHIAAAVEAARPLSILRRHEETGQLGLQIYIPVRFTGKKWFLLKSIFSADGDAPFRFDLPEIVQGTGLFIPFNSHEALLNDLPKNMEITRTPVPPALNKEELTGIVFVSTQGMTEGDVEKLKKQLLALPNNHMSYAFIWFSLAFILVVIYLHFTIKKT